MIAIALALALTAPDKVDVRPSADLAVGAVALVAIVVPDLFQKQLLAAHCRICDGPDNTGLPGTGSGGSLNAVDAWFHDATAGWLVSRGTSDVLSSVWAYGVVPVGAFAAALTATGPHASDGAGWRAASIIEESAIVSAALVQGVKLAAVRKRPYVRYGTGETSGAYDVSDSGSRTGFPSGHTAWVTSLAVATATTVTLQESPAAPWVWGAAAVASVTAASLRMMAEKHYFTDVAAGALIGGACGVIVPLLHRRGGPLSSPSSVSVAQGPALAVSGTF
jgi:membrane-associated phospholipid phosphatase